MNKGNYKYQELTDNDYEAMHDVCMQIVTQALSKCFNIVPALAGKIVTEAKQQINHYRKQIPLRGESSNKKVKLSPNESIVFFNTIQDKFYQRSHQIIDQHSDMRSILSVILLGMQKYQDERTQIEALNCIKYLAETNQGYFRSKVWHWIKYTSI